MRTGYLPFLSALSDALGDWADVALRIDARFQRHTQHTSTLALLRRSCVVTTASLCVGNLAPITKRKLCSGDGACPPPFCQPDLGGNLRSHLSVYTPPSLTCAPCGCWLPWTCGTILDYRVWLRSTR